MIERRLFYWSIPLLLFAIQAIFVSHSFWQIRYEELAESVRNVFWFQNGFVYDGVSSNVGWYFLLYLIYNLFGFSLNTVLFFRLFIYLLSIVSAAFLLNKYFGKKYSIVALIAFGLSPTLLFFNTIRAEFGIDFETLPIFLFILDSLDFDKKLFSYIKSILFFSLLIFGAMIYSTFLFYIPSLLMLYIFKLKKHTPIINPKALPWILTGLMSFLLPLIIIFYFIKNNPVLIYDTVTKKGIFRGGGELKFDTGLIISNLKGVEKDLFQNGRSYYFEAAGSDFSDPFSIISMTFGLALFLIIIKENRKYRILFFSILIAMTLNLILSSLTVDTSFKPGIRRYTTVLSSIYLIYTLGYLLYLSKHTLKEGKPKLFILIVMLMLPVHHLSVLSLNLKHLQIPSPYIYKPWFNSDKNPEKTLNNMLKLLSKEDLYLNCDHQKNIQICRYPEVYASLAGACLWNKLDCHKIAIFDKNRDKFITPTIELWNSYYIQH